MVKQIGGGGIICFTILTLTLRDLLVVIYYCFVPLYHVCYVKNIFNRHTHIVTINTSLSASVFNT